MESWSRELDLRALADEFGTPLYVHNPAVLRRNFDAYLELVGDPGAIRYPVKANPSPLVLDRLASWGGGADCASATEVRLALDAGIGFERLSYNTPAIDLDLAAWLLVSGASVVADSFEVLDALAERFVGRGFAGELFVRVNPGGLPGYRTASEVQKYTSHGSATSQFGIPSEELVDYLADYSLTVTGLHMHVGTQMDNLDTFVEGIRFIHALADLVNRIDRHRVDVLNLGGGLGIPFLDGQEFPTIDELVAALEPEKRDDFRYQVEPGNSLVGDAMALVTRVVGTKTTRGRRWAIVDVGTDQLVKFTVARWEHRIVDAAGEPLPRTGPDALAGPLCFAGDVLLPETDLGAVETGDPLLVQHAGAYCEAVSSRFNGRRAPAHVVLEEDGTLRRARRAEDPFLDPALQTLLGEPVGDGDWAAALGAERVAALQSGYMHRMACDDRYQIEEAGKLAEREYRFVMDTRGAVDFVAMPFAVRMVGDAAIIAVGCELGWREKPGPVWATRMTMTCGELIPSGRVTCHIRVSALAPNRSGALTGRIHYDLGEGRFTGVAQVVVPPVQAEAERTAA